MNIQSPHNFIGKTHYFGVETLYGAQQKHSISYVIGCTYSQTEEGQVVVSIERKQFFIDGIEPQKLVDQLADYCMSFLYPISWELSPEGTLIGLADFKGLQKKWQQALPKIREGYKGGEVNAYLNKIAASLEDQQTTQKALLQDICYSLLLLRYETVDANNIMVAFPVQPFLPKEYFTGKLTMLEHETLLGNKFEGVSKHQNRLHIKKWHFKKDHSLHQLKVKLLQPDDTETHFKLIRLKEREEDQASFYITPEEEALEVQPKKKKRKWGIF